MVKPKSDVWRYYDLKDKDNYCCKYCKTSFKRNATRQLQHLLKCVKISENVVQILKGKLPVRNVSSSNNNTTPSSTEILEDSDTETTSQQGQGESLDSEIASLIRPASSSASSLFSSTSKASKGTISSYFDNMSAQENNKIDELLARAIYVSGAALDMTTKKVWLDVFKTMRCAYKPPSRYQLSNPLLESEYTRVKTAVSSKISEAPILSLQMDGWSNCRNDSISNFVINTPLPVFYKSIHTEDNRHLATFLASEIEKVLEELGPSNFLAIVTDNGANIKKAREIVSSKYDYITNYGCICHGLNLLVEDFLKLDYISNFKKNIISIVSELKNSQILHARFEKIQLNKTGRYISLKLPVKTRWGSFVSCLKSFLDTKHSLKRLAVDDSPDISDVLSSNTVILLLQNEFWLQLEATYDLFKPISKWITIFEANGPTISRVFTCFFEIRSILRGKVSNLSITRLENKKMCSILEKRENKCLKPVHLAAYLLEPNQRGDNLTEAENLIATEFIYETARRHPKYSSQVDLIMEALAQYKIRGNIFAKEFVISSEKSMSGPVWWAGICSSSKISRLAVDILNLPSSTAATERTFSTYGFIHRLRRNRLTVERAGKLTYIAHNYNLLNEEDHSRIVEASEQEVEKEDIDFEVIDLTQLTKEKEASDDEDGDDDEDDLPLSTLLRNPF